MFKEVDKSGLEKERERERERERENKKKIFNSKLIFITIDF